MISFHEYGWRNWNLSDSHPCITNEKWEEIFFDEICIYINNEEKQELVVKLYSDHWFL